MSDTPAWAVERAREILALIDVEPSEWCPDCDGQGEIDDGKCGRCGKYGCRTKTCPACNGGKMKPIDRVGIISSALTVPDGHVRLPSGDQSLPWKVIHVASNEVVASFKWGDVAQTYIKRGIEIGGWHEHELRLQQAAESARAGGGA